MNKQERKCRKCGSTVVITQNRCPHCGCATPWLSNEEFRKFGIWTAIIFSVITLATACLLIAAYR